METKEDFTRRELERVLQEWSARTALLGAVIFLALGPLDFFSSREHAVRFLCYRIIAAACLTGCALLLRRQRRPLVVRALVFAAVLVSAVALEAMILDYGGHRSPYVTGLILVAVVVAGLIPSGAGFAALLAGTIFLVYLLPILAWDTIVEPLFFVVNTSLFFVVMAAGVLIRWFHQGHLEREIAQRAELLQSGEHLRTEIAKRTGNEDRLSLFAAAVEGAAEGIFIVDLEGRVVHCNAAAAQQSGRSPAEIVGQNIREMHRNPAALEEVVLPTLQRRGRWAGEVQGTTVNGQPLLLWLTASLVRNAEGQPIAMVGLTRDLSSQKKLEADLVRTQKLESIGVLAGGLAHDFNNLLTIILGNLDLARLFIGPSPEGAEALDHASEAALRAGDLTRQLVTFSKGGQPLKRAGGVARTLRETVLFAAAGSNVACEFAIPDELPPVDFDEGQLRQVFHNLVQNAREAMPEGGKLRISACAAELAEDEVPGLPAGNYLRLEFADTGSGIPREHLGRIFDPYFSTKGMDTVKGRGLGLAVSYAIVGNHGGTIIADSLVGAGTTIAVYLPATTREIDVEDEENPEETPEDTVEPPAAGTESLPEGPPRARVLVMDDEPLVLEMSAAALRRLGYAATLCRSGAEAVVHYQIGLDRGRRFDAVILDLTVPGGPGGPETLARLRQIDPGVRAALSSGYTDHPAVRDWAGRGFTAFISKPYSLKELEELLVSLV